MSKIWPHATKQNPCPICGHPDWCCFGDKAVKCMRVESEHADANGGWYHFYEAGAAKPRTPLPARKEVGTVIDAERILAAWESRAQRHNSALATGLGVREVSLNALGCTWADKTPEGKPINAWAFPMRDGAGKAVGIRLRSDNGYKWALTGSKQGLFEAPVIDPTEKVAYLPEGPTDTAAFLSMGMFAIGRPTALTGHEYLRETLARLRIFRVVIVADNDGVKRIGNREGYPGIEAAHKLQKELRLKSVIYIPPSPCKDIRELLNRVGARQARAVIEADINNRVWSK